MPQSDLPYRLALSRVSRIGAQRMALLESHFDSLADAWTASDAELRQAGLDGATLRSLHQTRGRTDPGHRDGGAGRPRGCRPTRPADDAYPSRLREIYGAPPVLFVRGEISARRRVVGGGGGDAPGVAVRAAR